MSTVSPTRVAVHTIPDPRTPVPLSAELWLARNVQSDVDCALRRRDSRLASLLTSAALLIALYDVLLLTGALTVS